MEKPKTGKKMTKKEYVELLKRKGYEILGDTQVALGSLIFDICEASDPTANGEQRAFFLKLSPKSDINLCPPPWK